MGHKSRSDKKSFGPRNRISIFGSGRRSKEEIDENKFAGEAPYSDDIPYSEETFDEDPDFLLRRAIDQKRGMFKKPPRPVYDSWNLPEEASIMPVSNHAGRGPKGYKRSDDRIREDVCEALTIHPGIDASDMEVTVKDGVVTFKGSVESRLIKRMAEDLIENIPGVADVRNELYFTNGPVVAPKVNGNGKRKHNDVR